MRSIFLFAHQDDEFGCYETIRRAVLAGEHVECYYLTDGGYAGQSTGRRDAESRRVLLRLGVYPSDIFFLGKQESIPDGSLYQYMLIALKALVDKIASSGDVAAIYAPAWEGGHQDHDAAHVIAAKLSECCSVPTSLWQFPLYNGAGLKRAFFHVMKPLQANGDVVVQKISIRNRFTYIRLCLLYPSQWKSWIGLFPFVALKILIGGHYYLQQLNYCRINERPHGGALLYERRGATSYLAVAHEAEMLCDLEHT